MLGLCALAFALLFAAFTYAVFRRLRMTPVPAILAATLVSIAPVVIFRASWWHLFAGAFWVIPAGIYLYLARRGRSGRFRTWPWVTLTVAAVVIHPYLAVFALAFWSAAAVREVLDPDRHHATPVPRIRFAALEIAAAAGAIFIPVFLIAGSFTGQGSTGAVGLGDYYSNLLTFIDPNDVFSSLIPDVPAAREGLDYEGYAFLGLAGMVAIIAAGVIILVNRRGRAMVAVCRRNWPLVAAMAALALYATAGIVAIGPWEVLALPLPDAVERALSTFRSSGRFMAAPAILILVYAFAFVGRVRPPHAAVAMPSVLLVIQIADGWQSFDKQRGVDALQGTDYPGLTDVDLAAAGSLTSVLPENSGYEWKLAVLERAAPAGVPFDDAFCGRADEPALASLRAAIDARVRTQGLVDRGAYLLYPGMLKQVGRPTGSSVVIVGDSLVVTNPP